MRDLGMSHAQMLSLIAVVVGIPAATYYPFMFARIRFWKSDIGKSMLTKGIALLLVFWFAIGTIPAVLFGWLWYEWAQAFVNSFLVIAVWYQVVVMRRVQKSGELKKRMGTEESESGEDVETLER